MVTAILGCEFFEKVVVRNKLMQMAREPLIQFLIIGACIYGVYALFGAPDEEAADKTIIVDAGRIDDFVGEWQRSWN